MSRVSLGLVANLDEFEQTKEASSACLSNGRVLLMTSAREAAFGYRLAELLEVTLLLHSGAWSGVQM